MFKKVGRPQKYNKDEYGKNLDKKKLTLEIGNRVYKALQVKKAIEEITINTYVEQLEKSIESKYVEIVKIECEFREIEKQRVELNNKELGLTYRLQDLSKSKP